MGDCVSREENDIILTAPLSDEENTTKTPPPPELRSKQISRFLGKAQNDPDIGKYFTRLNSYKIEELSLRICVMFNYAFKYQTITPFEDVLKMHTTMGISEEDAEIFLDLLREECFHMEARETAVQKRIFKRMKLFIVYGGGHKVRLSIGGKVVWGTLGNVKHFYPLVRRNSILKRQFDGVSPSQMEGMTEMLDKLLSTPNVIDGTLVELGLRHKHLFISGIEFDTFIMLWLREYQKDVHFVTRAMPIIDRLRSHFVMAHERKILDLCHMLKISRVLSSWIKNFKECKMRSLCAATLKYLDTAHKDTSNQSHLDLSALLHQDLQMTEDEFLEFQRIYGLIIHNEKNSAALTELVQKKSCIKYVQNSAPTTIVPINEVHPLRHK